MNAILTLEQAQEIAEEFGYTRDIQPEIDLANSARERFSPANLFRGYMQEYTAERNSEARMLERTGYGLID